MSDLLLKYYREDPSGILDKWVAFGTRKDCVDKIEKFVSVGVNTFSIRFVAWDQLEQLKRFSEDVLSSFNNRAYGSHQPDPRLVVEGL